MPLETPIMINDVCLVNTLERFCVAHYYPQRSNLLMRLYPAHYV
jgi:hypothetical protein